MLLEEALKDLRVVEAVRQIVFWSEYIDRCYDCIDELIARLRSLNCEIEIKP